MEEAKAILTESGKGYPVVIIPKRCTMLESDCDANDNVFIDLNITFFDPSGNQTIIYSGFCNVKIIDDINTDNESSSDQFDSDNVLGEVTLPDCSDSSNDYPIMLVDPMNDSYSNNDHGTVEAEESYSVYETHEGYVTVRHENMAIMDNLYNYNECVESSPLELELNMSGGAQRSSATPQTLDPSFDEELECSVLLSQIPEEIMMADDSRVLEGLKYMDASSQDEALKQLLSMDSPHLAKPQRTIMYLGENARRGTTVQKIAVNDPNVKCRKTRDSSVLFDETPSKKVYQCDKCKQIFNRIQAFKRHIDVKHITNRPSEPPANYICRECGKVLKTREKLEAHCSGHGDPEKECDKCHKVLSSKATLRNHKKLHQRKHKCTVCKKSFQTPTALQMHLLKLHYYRCSLCDYTTPQYVELVAHEKEHYDEYSDITVVEDWPDSVGELMVAYDSQNQEQDAALAKLMSDEIYLSDSEKMEKPYTNSDKVEDWEVTSPVVGDAVVKYEEISPKQDQDPDSVIAMAISSDIFQMPATKLRKSKPKKFKKICCVCSKHFDRISDLKRHLIEHVIRCTLAVTPVSSSGALSLQCAVCRAHVFTKIDRYKAHLREHAQLTIYKCVNCKKSFSDSSNFSKHKKVHGAAFYQCDLCQRKFQSKKTLTTHIEYHNNNPPLPCDSCDRRFHLPSLLNRHIKHAHAKDIVRPKCRFCNVQFLSLKATWDHEWLVHNARKMIVDCLICEAKFRKYSELKRHCKKVHKIDIPKADKLLRSARHGRIQYGDMD